MKQVKYALTTIVLFCTLFLVSSFQSRDNFNAEDVKYSIIRFENMTNDGGISYVFSYLNYNEDYGLGAYYYSGNRSGYIILSDPNEDAYGILLAMLQVAADFGWDVGDFDFTCYSYFGSDIVKHYVKGSYSPLKIEAEFK